MGDSDLVHGRYRISVESDGRRQWFRLRLGGAVLADNVRTPEELERELARFDLTVDQFGPERG